jgi:hypothetical protein
MIIHEHEEMNRAFDKLSAENKIKHQEMEIRIEEKRKRFEEKRKRNERLFGNIR